MTERPAFIGVDWGTSNARFMLITRNGVVLDEKQGVGIGRIDDAKRIESICFDTVKPWLSAGADVPILMAGMVGSNIGWRTAGYVGTPASFDDLAADITRFEARGTFCAIVPGVETIRHDGAADVMRGEETQIFGVADGGDQLFCLPGTHSKWAKVSGGSITGFHTAQTGELLDVIGQHSILLNPRRPVSAQVGAAFQSGVDRVRTSVLGLESLMFTVRSQQISGVLPAAQADSYFAGIAIGCEIRSALALYSAPVRLTLVGSANLTALYASALQTFGWESERIDGRTASVAGLTKIAQRMAA